MEVPNVTQGTIITSAGTTYVADRRTINLLGFDLTQRQLLTGGLGVLLGLLLAG